jgi:hypothetical protein
MAVKVDDIFNEMMGAGSAAFGAGWSAVAKYAPAEFRKMAVQIEDIASNVLKYQADKNQVYSADTGQVLLKMHKRSLEAVLVATTQLTLIAVEKAINAILDVLKKAFQGALATILP